MGPHDEFLPFVKSAYCIMSRLVTEHLSTFTLLCFLGSRVGGAGCLNISTVLNSLMQFSNATYSFHVSLEAFTCEIAKACLA